LNLTTLIPPRSFAYIVGEELARALDLQDPLINLFGIEIAEHEATAMLAEDHDVSAIKTNAVPDAILLLAVGRAHA
jgi:hypothetical protein